MRLRFLAYLGMACALWINVKVSAAVPVGISKNGLLFYAGFNSQTPDANFAGGNPKSLTFTRTLQYLPAPGVIGAGFQTQGNETSRYAMAGNFNPTQGTVGFWVRTENWIPADRRGYAFFVAEIPGTYRMLIAKPASDEALTFSIELKKEGKTFRIVTPITWIPRSWHSVDADWDGRSMSLFIDGVRVGQVDIPGKTVFPSPAKDGIISINPNNYFGGTESRPEDISTVDEVFIYGRVLTDAEIAAARTEVKNLFFPDRRNQVISVPFDPAPVTLDGRIDESEWAGASRIPIQNLSGKSMFSNRLAWVLLKYNNQGLCLGFHVSGDPAPVAQVKNRDGNVWEDDAFEAVVSPSKNIQIQFAINSANVVFDMKNNDAKWNGVFLTAAGRDGDGWSAKVILPYGVLGVSKPAVGTVWRCNFMYDWDQRMGGFAAYAPFLFGGEASFSNPRYMGSLVFTGEKDAVKIMSIGELTTGIINTRVLAPAGASVRFVAGSSHGLLKNVTMDSLGRTVEFPAVAPVNSDDILAITVTGTDGKILAIYDQQFSVSPPVTILTKYLPTPGVSGTPGTLQVTLDFANLDAVSRKRLMAGAMPVTVSLLDVSGKAVVSVSANPKASPAMMSLPIAKNFVPGHYRVRAVFPTETGMHDENLPLLIPSFAPISSRAGISHYVPDPWTPVVVAGNTLRVLNREYRLDNAPFPVQMMSLGAPLLKKPFTLMLETDTRREKFSWKSRRAGEAFPDKVSFSGEGIAGTSGVMASWKATAEFDGLWLTTVTLKPAGKPVTVKSLTLEFAVERASAEYVLALLNKTWKNDHVDLDLFNNIDSVVGPESPNGGFWLTGLKTGIYFFTTTDGNWVVTPKVPNVFISRHQNEVLVRVTIITKPVLLKKPASYVFGVCATPARPKPVKHFASGDTGYIFQTSRWETWASLVPLNPKNLRRGVEEQRKKGVKYMFQYSFPGILKDDPYYAFWNPLWQGCLNHKTLRNLIAYRVENLAKNFGVGPYFDMNGVTWCCPYTDAFGQQSKTIPILGLRDTLKRAYRIAHKYGCEVWNHNHSEFIPAAHVFSDIWFPGEQYLPFIRGNNHFYSRFVPRDAYLVEMNPFIHGMDIVFLPEVVSSYAQDGEKDPGKWATAKYAWYTEQLLAMLLPHDIDYLEANIYTKPMEKVNEIFKKENIIQRLDGPGPRAQFVGYWDNPAVKSDNAQVMVSYYTIQGEKKVVVVAGNPELKPLIIRLSLDRKRLGLYGPLVVRDAYRNRELPDWQDGIEIPAENFVILVMKQGVSSPVPTGGNKESVPLKYPASNMAQKQPVNLLNNPGFEESVQTDVNKTDAELLSRGVELAAGNAVAMPVDWWLNPGDGWLVGQKNVFRYVKGEAGKEVHSGKHAVFLSSLGHCAIVASSSTIRVLAENIPDMPSISLNKPNRFSIWAKGSGKLMVYMYTYDKWKSNIYGKSKSTPEEFTLTDKWRKYEGTIEFTGQDVGFCLFVIGVNAGEATVDDAKIYAQ